MLAITPPVAPAPDGLKEVREGPKEFQEVRKEAKEAWSTPDTVCRPVTQVNKAAPEVHSLQTLPWLNKLFHRR